MTGRFLVDLDQLADVVRDLTAQHQQLDELTRHLDVHTSELHDAWDGQASDAHLAAHARWQAGFATMRHALAAMRRSAETADRNYSGAAEANLTMWRQLG